MVANVGGKPRERLRGTPCRCYPIDFRIGARGHTYTDGHVICGPTRLDDRDPPGQTATNPTLVIEVLSPTTEAYDRGGKFVRYMQAESLREYVLVSANEPRVHVFFRQPDGTWLFTPTVGADAVARLRSLPVDLPLAGVYLNVTFPAPPGDPPAVP